MSARRVLAPSDAVELRGRRAVVVGSAPGALFPEEREGDVYLCANGGARLAIEANREPGVLFTTTYLLRPNRSPAESATLASLAGLYFPIVVMDEKAGPAPSATALRERFSIWTETLVRVPPIARGSVVRWATGEDLRVSTGVFAAILAVSAGASEVVLVGIDPESSGHAGVPGDVSRRDHVVEDRRAIEILVADGRVEVYRGEEAA